MDTDHRPWIHSAGASLDFDVAFASAVSNTLHVVGDVDTCRRVVEMTTVVVFQPQSKRFRPMWPTINVAYNLTAKKYSV